MTCSRDRIARGGGDQPSSASRPDELTLRQAQGEGLSRLMQSLILSLSKDEGVAVTPDRGLI